MELVEGKVNWKGKPAVKNIHGGIKAASFVLVAFGFENLANLHMAVNLVTYFNGVLHMKQSDAANALTNFMGTGYILSILFALFADTFVGRFKTVLIAGFIEFLGLALLAVQAHYSSLRPPPCNVFDPTSHCEKLKSSHAVFLYVALYLVAAGMGGIKAGVPSHGADQFEEKDPREAKQMSSFFNGLLFFLCVGGAISLTLIVWLDDHKGWDVGFGVSSIAMFLALVVAVLGWPLYRIHVVQGTSVIVEIIQVFVAAIHNRNLQLPENPLELYEIDKDKEAAWEDELLPHRDIYRFLDKAAIQTASQTPNPWKLCTVTQVESAKIILGMVPIFACTIIMTLCLAQLQTFSVQQGLTMDTTIVGSFNIPPASLPIIPVIFLIILIPLYDQIIVPLFRKFTGRLTGITHLQRIGVGLILSSISMATAAIMEVKRKSVARDHNMVNALPVLQPLPISVFWLSFQYFIFGIADMFTYVGLLEFFYSEAPKKIKTMSTCFLWTSMALGYYLSTILVQVVNRATKNNTRSGGWLAGNNINKNHLNLFYLLLSLMSLANFIIYLIVSSFYKYRFENKDEHKAEPNHSS
ncbi:ABA-importing transporter 1, NRT1/ PTR family 4.6, nitrate transporter 1:2 [Hibiscus trionum]|uniref:ABA-importing transporter 1, NRT1/ PTR family 4.6, nitrate transporter 1:2 n=1 Tax=Hibiscus trionum TaxID=183268 RepID=A0A9W7H907_HIBTR|nr:ABA-importing transporter 1, NRT1/ PTR family 4.6, nitrate transporter 1:2 [Hibiscus trionum]